MTLDEARSSIGKAVLYHAYPGAGGAETGVITSVNDTYVFVRYGANETSAATSPGDLELHPVTVAIVGSRSGLPWDLVQLEIEALVARPEVKAVATGGAHGVDAMAEREARAQGKEVKLFLPDWERHGRGAGFFRNQLIVDASDEVYAFWDGTSRGTNLTINLAHRARKPVHVRNFLTTKPLP